MISEANILHILLESGRKEPQYVCLNCREDA